MSLLTITASLSLAMSLSGYLLTHSMLISEVWPMMTWCFTNNVIVDIQCVAVTCNVTQWVLTCHSMLIREIWPMMTWCFPNNVIVDIQCVAVTCNVTQWVLTCHSMLIREVWPMMT